MQVIGLFFFFFPKWKEVFKILVMYFYDMILLQWYLPLWFFPTALLVFPSFMCSSFFPHLFITCWCYSALLGFILFVLCICARNFFYSDDFSCHIHCPDDFSFLALYLHNQQRSHLLLDILEASSTQHVQKQISGTQWISLVGSRIRSCSKARSPDTVDDPFFSSHFLTYVQSFPKTWMGLPRSSSDHTPV